MLAQSRLPARTLFSRLTREYSLSCAPPLAARRSLFTSTRVFNSRNLDGPTGPSRPHGPSETGTSESKTSASFEDPTRPGLWYHFTPAPKVPKPNKGGGDGAFACSFLSESPKRPDSSTVLGYVPAIEGAGLHDFQENKKFIELMHETIKKALSEGADEALTAEAAQRGGGWIHINDERNVPALGRIGDPDDIIASVRVDEGKIIADSYERMPAYRICTGDGLVTLSKGLARHLQQRLQRQHESDQ